MARRTPTAWVVMEKPATRASPRRGRQQRGEHLDRGGLAGPVGAEQAENLTGVDRKRQRIHRRKRAEAAGQVFDFENNVTHDSFGNCIIWARRNEWGEHPISFKKTEPERPRPRSQRKAIMRTRTTTRTKSAGKLP